MSRKIGLPFQPRTIEVVVPHSIHPIHRPVFLEWPGHRAFGRRTRKEFEDT
jgi:hypothetical protein